MYNARHALNAHTSLWFAANLLYTARYSHCPRPVRTPIRKLNRRLLRGRQLAAANVPPPQTAFADVWTAHFIFGTSKRLPLPAVPSMSRCKSTATLVALVCTHVLHTDQCVCLFLIKQACQLCQLRCQLRHVNAVNSYCSLLGRHRCIELLVLWAHERC